MLIPLYSFLNCLTPTFIASTCEKQIIAHDITAVLTGVTILGSIGNQVDVLSEDLLGEIFERSGTLPLNKLLGQIFERSGTFTLNKIDQKDHHLFVTYWGISTGIISGWIYIERKPRPPDMSLLL